MASIRFRVKLGDGRQSLPAAFGETPGFLSWRLGALLAVLVIVLNARGGFQTGRVDPAKPCQIDVAVKPDRGYYGDRFAFYVAVHPPYQRSIPTVLGLFHDGTTAARPVGFGRFVAYGGFVDPGESTGQLEFQAVDRAGQTQCSQVSPSIINLGVRPN